MCYLHFPMWDQISYDLLLNILSRLPVQSLLRFRCVSKSWYSIISHDHYFCNLHRLNHKNNPKIVSCPDTSLTYTGHYFSTTVRATAISTYDALSFSLLSHRLLRVPSLDIRQKNRAFVAQSEIISSCHGVLCIRVDTKDNQYSIFLYNPSIRKFNFVISYSNTKKYLVGFGHAPLHNDYKVVMVGMDKPEPVRVYSLRNTTTWSVLPTAPVGLQPVHPARSGTYLNGKCHWPVWIPNRMDDNQYDIKLPPNNSVWYFDLDSNTFGYFMQPHDCPSTIHLMVYKDMLSFYFLRNSQWKVWVMKEYGVFDSWSPLFILDFSKLPPADCFFSSPRVVEMDVDSKILVQGSSCSSPDYPIVSQPSHGKLHDNIELCWPEGRSYYAPLMVYDHQNKKADFLGLLGHSSDYFHYQESLVLLNENRAKL